MNIKPKQQSYDIEALLEQAGQRMSSATASAPSRSTLQSVIRSAHVTNPTAVRYISRTRIKFFLSAMVAAILLIAIGGTSYYFRYSHSAPVPIVSGQSSAAVSGVASSGQTPPAADAVNQQSDQDIDQSITQIDSQLNGLSQDNQNMDQSAQP